MTHLDYENLLEDFNLLETWEDKYRYIMDLGNELDPYPSEFKIENYRVLGCASQVWFYPIISKVEDKKMFSFKGDSDAVIVRGLIKILTIIYSDNLVSNLQDTDPFEKIKMLGLQDHLSSQRSNGLKSMISKIQEIIKENS